MLDAPVSGGDVGAKEGTLSIMVGGNPEIFDKCIPIFKILGNTFTHIGKNVGDGCYAKMANQIMVAINMAALVEALSFSKAVEAHLPFPISKAVREKFSLPFICINSSAR